jgi:hypothetical protein
MRGFGLGLAVLAATFGVVAGCGDTDADAPNGDEAGSPGQSVSGAGGAASGGKSGGASGGSSAGTTSGGASASGSASGGTGVGGSSAAGAPAEAGAPSGGTSGLYDCDPKKVTCKIATPQCPSFEVPSVEGTCWGECVKIAQCACSAADDCPDQNQYTCWSKQHCGPYVL